MCYIFIVLNQLRNSVNVLCWNVQDSIQDWIYNSSWKKITSSKHKYKERAFSVTKSTWSLPELEDPSCINAPFIIWRKNGTFRDGNRWQVNHTLKLITKGPNKVQLKLFLSGAYKMISGLCFYWMVSLHPKLR